MSAVSTERSDAREKVAELLTKLGNTPDEIAATLDRESCKGKLRGCWECPVWSYLAKHGFPNTRAMSFTVMVVYDWHTKFCVQLPEAVQTFITMFDAGWFEYLCGPAYPTTLEERNGLCVPAGD